MTSRRKAEREERSEEEEEEKGKGAGSMLSQLNLHQACYSGCERLFESSEVRASWLKWAEPRDRARTKFRVT
jgi:hypothetical protein